MAKGNPFPKKAPPFGSGGSGKGKPNPFAKKSGPPEDSGMPFKKGGKVKK